MNFFLKASIIIGMILAVIGTTYAPVYSPGVAERIIKNALIEVKKTGTIKDVVQFKQAYQDLPRITKEDYQDDYVDVIQAVEKQRLEKKRLESERLANQLHITNKSANAIVVRFYYRSYLITSLAHEYSAYSIAPGRDIYLDLPKDFKSLSRYIVVADNADDFKEKYTKKAINSLIDERKAFFVKEGQNIIIDTL